MILKRKTEIFDDEVVSRPISNVRDTRGKIAILLEAFCFSCPWSSAEVKWPLSCLLDFQTLSQIEMNGSVGVDVAID